MQPLERYHQLSPGRRYEVVWEWEIDGHEVAFGYHEVDWGNGVTHRSPSVFCECDVTCKVIDGRINVLWSGDCIPKQKAYELGAVGARAKYNELWSDMQTDDAIQDILQRVANLEWLGQHDGHIYPNEIENLLKDTPMPPESNDILERLRLMAAIGQIKTIENYWYFVDPVLPE
jgi:hypothetical protein